MINKDIFTKDIFEDARARSERLKIISSFLSEKKWNELLNFIKNNQGGLIEISVFSYLQMFFIRFLVFVFFLYFIYYYTPIKNFNIQCPSSNKEIANNNIITKICLIEKNIFSEKIPFYLFLKNFLSLILDFLPLLWLIIFFGIFFNYKTLQIDIINQKLSLKNLFGKTIKSYSFYELKNFYHFNIKDIQKTNWRFTNFLFRKPPAEEYSDNYPNYQFVIEIINKRNNKKEGEYIATGSFYSAEFLEAIFKDIENI